MTLKLLTQRSSGPHQGVLPSTEGEVTDPAQALAGNKGEGTLARSPREARVAVTPETDRDAAAQKGTAPHCLGEQGNAP